jgi:hypothetical protein
MADLIPPNTQQEITKDGLMSQRFRDWTQAVTRLINLFQMAEGVGSPETVLIAGANKFYRDTAAGALYWKSVDDIAGDASLGWKLIV